MTSAPTRRLHALLSASLPTRYHALLLGLALGGAVGMALNVPGPGSDLYAFWSFAKFVHSQLPGQIYDPAALHAFQRALNGYDVGFPFVYPPAFLLVLWPLALFPFWLASALWLGGTLAAYLAALVRRDSRTTVVLVVLAAPSTLACWEFGQAGFLIGALLIGGFRLVGRQPVLGGVLLGLAAIKPQLAILIPLALIAAGLWRSLIAAIGAGLALVLLSSAALGWGIWLRWIEALPRLSAALDAHRATIEKLMPTVAGNLHLLGVAGPAVYAAQIAAVGFAVCAVWRGFRDGPDGTATATILVAAFLATPYALIYDLPLLTGAAIISVQERLRHGGSLHRAEIAILLAAYFLPFLIGAFKPFAFSSLPIAALLGAIMWRATRRPHAPSLATAA